jgi:hypothetical protein
VQVIFLLLHPAPAYLCAKKEHGPCGPCSKQKRREFQLAILATTILSAGLCAGIQILATVKFVVVHTFLATSLTTCLLAALWISSWCLLAVALSLALTIVLALATHVPELVILHSVVCHGKYPSQLFDD